ncbi:hypothetical protein B5X24_HaOG212860 [Helicoverpa armigera]|uniref:Uncharacterized protein n=1 Tax=Helicoverpa armigera TaxID=29058 RepID=A0A2W1BFM7_HELAM|nr:hypothetical protein B5X24_HaOG212860 [Helicoverpa armigera]
MAPITNSVICCFIMLFLPIFVQSSNTQLDNSELCKNLCRNANLRQLLRVSMLDRNELLLPINLRKVLLRTNADYNQGLYDIQLIDFGEPGSMCDCASAKVMRLKRGCKPTRPNTCVSMLTDKNKEIEQVIPPPATGENADTPAKVVEGKKVNCSKMSRCKARKW